MPSNAKLVNTKAPMKSRRFASLLALFAASFPVIAHAEGFDANQYQPTPVASDGLTVARPTSLQHGALGVVGTLSYAHDPLIERMHAPDGHVAASRMLIRDQVYGFVGVSYGLWNSLTLHATLPFALIQSGEGPSLSFERPAATSTAIGDLRLGVRAPIVGGFEGDRPSRFGLALDVSAFLPTGSRDALATDGKTRAQVSLITEVLPTDYLYVGANAGVMARPNSEVTENNVGFAFHMAGSAGLRTERDRFRIGAEVTSKTRMDATAFQGGASAVETLGVAAMRFLDGGLVASIGAGPGFSSSPGSPDFRAIARVGWAPNVERNYVPEPVEDPYEVKPTDRDRDEIEDFDDACPDVPGVRHADPAKNGCPSDRDSDGIVDTQDACPDVAGVKHDDPAKNGCPSDRDSDGIVDTQDACPDVAGVTSDDPELNGCPPVKVTEKAIEITDKIHFEFAKANLMAESDTTLKGIAKALRDHPQIKKLSIEGHTDERGGDAFNMNLSRLRADAVRAWLVAHGIEASRLATQGFGKTRPIADNATDEGREKNRRVEFRIVEGGK